MALTGSSTEQKIWNYLVSHGLSAFGAAGLMGNIYAESGLEPKNLQNSCEKKLGYDDLLYTTAVDTGAYKKFETDNAGYGLCQWTYHTRKKALLEFAKKQDKSIGDLEMQLDFLMKEFGESYASVLDALKSATSVRAASDCVLLKFERPADQGENAKAKRARVGQAYYDKYANQTTKAETGVNTVGKTNTGLVAYAKAQIGLPYWYGCFGQTATAELLASKRKQYPSYYTASDFDRQIGKRVHDCVGLVKGYLWSVSTTAKPAYNAKQDVSAKGMYDVAKIKGAISTFQKKTGLLVFKSKTNSPSGIHHVGVYGGDGYVYEAKGHAYGTVKTLFKASEWQFWAQCPFLTDDSDTKQSAPVKSSASATVAIEKKTAPAQSKDRTLAGTYTLTGDYNVRYIPGVITSDNVVCVAKKGDKVRNYGYYTDVNGKKWLYVEYGDKVGYISAAGLKKS